MSTEKHKKEGADVHGESQKKLRKIFSSESLMKFEAEQELEAIVALRRGAKEQGRALQDVGIDRVGGSEIRSIKAKGSPRAARRGGGRLGLSEWICRPRS